MKSKDIYNGKKEELVLALFSNLYSELKTISISASGLSSCSTSHCLLTA